MSTLTINIRTDLNVLSNKQRWVYVSQMTTYWFVVCWFSNQRTQKSKVRQMTKDVVKSEVYPQTYSP